MFLLGLSILIGQFFNPTWFLQGVENVKWITYLNVISKAIYVLGIFFIIKSESDYIYINLCWGVGMIIANFIFFIVIIKKHQFSFSIVSKREVFNHFKNDFSMFSSQIFVSLQLYAPVVLVSFFVKLALLSLLFLFFSSLFDIASIVENFIIELF